MTNKFVENLMVTIIGIYIFVIFYGLIHPLLPWHEEIPTQQEYQLSTTHILVNWYNSELELQDALDDSGIAGLSECEHRPEFNTSFCELWLVHPTDNEDAYAFDTIGHEFYHALVGDFHAVD